MEIDNIRVLHIDTEHAWGGGQQQVAYLMDYMHKQGLNNTALVCQPKSYFEKYCKEKGIPFYPVKMRGEMDFIAGYKIARLCKKNNFNILHLHSAHALASGLWAKLFYNKIKLIGSRRVSIHIRNNPLSLFKYSNRMIDKIVCVSNQIKDTLLKDGIPEHLVVTIYSGVDLKKFTDVLPPPAFRKQWNIPDDHILVGTVASMVEAKDYPTFLKAAKIITDINDKITFFAVGNGPKEKEIYDFAKDLGLSKRFIFSGFQKEVGIFLKSFDIFVLSSSFEGLGTSILDAQGVGLPVVATKTGGIPEIIRHNVNGMLIEQGNPQALADAIVELATNKEKRKTLGEKAMETVKDFSIENTVQKNLSLYKEILNSKKP
ncbi:MAG: glycosyltransferase family 4 protein [Desulfobacterales bacterium]|nr:glycosyltransferase family 4 protein [Desulfobacterales bacterium]